jgi:hypothetical protein
MRKRNDFESFNLKTDTSELFDHLRVNNQTKFDSFELYYSENKCFEQVITKQTK